MSTEAHVAEALRDDALPLQAYGDFPPYLRRFMNELTYARDFVERGRIRLALVQSYVAIEDRARRDGSEGQAKIQILALVPMVTVDRHRMTCVNAGTAPGILNYGGTFLNLVYVCCFSFPPAADEPLLAQRFGHYVVRIHDPKRLAQEITRALQAERKLGPSPVVRCCRVAYTKGEIAAAVPTAEERAELAYRQKPPAFASDHEYRFVVISNRPARERRNPSCEFHSVEIGSCMDYTELDVLPVAPSPCRLSAPPSLAAKGPH